jgi:sarcosine oxidase
MAAWRAAAGGLRVAGLDRWEPGHHRGASHGRSRIFRRLAWEGVGYARSAARSLVLLRELEAAAGRRLLQPAPGLVVAPAGSQFLQAVLDGARGASVPHQVLEGAALRERFGQFRTGPGDVGVLEPLAAVIDPEVTVRAALEQARAAGAVLRHGVAVTQLRSGPDGTWSVHAGEGEPVRARRVLLALGPWLATVATEGGEPIEARRSPLAWFTPSEPEAFAPQRFPVFVQRTEAGTFWGIPGVDGDGVKVGGVNRPMAHQPGENADRPITRAETAPIEGYVADRLPGLDPVPARTEPCMDGYTGSGDFVLAPVAGAPGVAVAGGLSGHGFKHAAAVGEAALAFLRDLPAGPGRTVVIDQPGGRG